MVPLILLCSVVQGQVRLAEEKGRLLLVEGRKRSSIYEPTSPEATFPDGTKILIASSHGLDQVVYLNTVGDAVSIPVSLPFSSWLKKANLFRSADGVQTAAKANFGEICEMQSWHGKAIGVVSWMGEDDHGASTLYQHLALFSSRGYEYTELLRSLSPPRSSSREGPDPRLFRLGKRLLLFDDDQIEELGWDGGTARVITKVPDKPKNRGQVGKRWGLFEVQPDFGGEPTRRYFVNLDTGHICDFQLPKGPNLYWHLYGVGLRSEWALYESAYGRTFVAVSARDGHTTRLTADFSSLITVLGDYAIIDGGALVQCYDLRTGKQVDQLRRRLPIVH